jgi:hypothetical protein
VVRFGAGLRHLRIVDDPGYVRHGGSMTPTAGVRMLQSRSGLASGWVIWRSGGLVTGELAEIRSPGVGSPKNVAARDLNYHQ